MTLTVIEDITPYDIYSTITVRDSVPAEHIQMISELLLDTLLDDNKPDRLTVSQPPRTAKTSLITLSFPFWLILMNPELNILIVNYSQGLADDFGMILRQLFIDNQQLLAERNIYLSDREHSKSKFRFENSKGELLGSIKLVGVGGPITGRDVDICICDDLIKGFSDCTPTLLDKLYSWYQNILIPRLEPWSKLFMLGTRWHPISNDCPVLTYNRGWTTHGNLKIGDYVFNPDGEPVKIINVHPKVFVDNVFEFNNGDTIISGDAHLWRVLDHRRKKEVIYTTQEIMNRPLQVSNGKTIRNNILINNINPLKYSKKELPIKPYWLGLWLGDGHHKRPSICVDAQDKQYSTENTGYDVIRYDKKNGNCYEAFYTHQGLVEKLKELKLYGNKHIPQIYLNSSIEQRLELLAGLIDSDGSVEKNSGRVVFTNTNKILIDNVHELIRGLGFDVRYNYVSAKQLNEWKKNNNSLKIHSNLDCYKIRFTPHIHIPSRIPRKNKQGKGIKKRISLLKAYKTEPVEGNCITIDSNDGMYLVGKNLTPTHNSQDVIGRLMTEQPEKYQFITLKALNDDGSCIWSNRYTVEFFEERRQEVGDRVFESQYQGQPLDETGDFFNLDTIIFEDTFQFDHPLITGKVRSWDFAYKDEEPGKDHDYTASCKMYRLINDTYYVTDVTMARYGDELLNTVKSYARMDTANVPILMETGTKGGAAHELYNQYKTHFTGYRVHESEAVGSKVDRATAFKYALLQGKIRFVLDDNKREILLRQLKGFPFAKHDDLIDALAYAFNYLSEHGESVVRTGKKMKREIL